MKQWTLNNKTITLYTKNKQAPLILYHCDHNEKEELWQQLKDENVTLACLEGFDWNADMSPWPMAPLFKKDRSIYGKADAYIQELKDVLLPSILEDVQPVWMGIAGYSLAGLFALYSSYPIDFQAVMCASGSLWYPDFDTYVFEKEVPKDLSNLYFSLGDKESQTRHPLMKTVADKTQAIVHFYQSKDIPTAFEWNPGNHMQDDVIRVVKGIRYLLVHAEN